MSEPKTVTTRVWVSRDCDHALSKNDIPYAIWKQKPRLEMEAFFSPVRQTDMPIVEDLCVRDFQRLTGLRLKPGECRQVDMTITMVPVEGGE